VRHVTEVAELAQSRQAAVVRCAAVAENALSEHADHQVTSYSLIDRPRNYRCVWSGLPRRAPDGTHQQKFESVNDLKLISSRLIRAPAMM